MKVIIFQIKKEGIFVLVKFLFLSVFLLLAGGGCVSSSKLSYDVYHPISRVFHMDYDKVWKALMLTLQSYSIEEEDRERGFVRTAAVKGDSIFKLPFPNKGGGPGGTQSYMIYVYLNRGGEASSPVVRVQVLKKVFARKGFIRGKQRVPSHGLEEKSILYRMMREIQIEQFILNRHKKTQSPM